MEKRRRTEKNKGRPESRGPVRGKARSESRKTEEGEVRFESRRQEKGKPEFQRGRPEVSKERSERGRPASDKPGFKRERPERGKPKFQRERPASGKGRSERGRPGSDKPEFERERPERGKPGFQRERPEVGKERSESGRAGSDKPGFERERPERKLFTGAQNPKSFRDRRNKKEFIPHMADETAAKGIQLNKYLSNSGIASRRKCEELIENGLVTVNDKPVLESGYRVQKNDVVKFKGERVFSARKYYVLLNKPKDFITTTSDEQGRRTVMELIEKASPERLYPVGRLDRNTTGLLLFTNDGELAQKLTHPSKQIKKVYEVTLNKELEEEDMQKIAAGIELEDGVATVDEIAFAHAMDKKVVGIELHIGKNRIVRRIFETLGYDVVKLDRVLYAGLTKKNLQRGHWRPLTEKEIRTLKYFS